MTDVTVAGAAAVWDYVFPVDRLPERGGIVRVAEDCPDPLPGGCAPSIALGIAKLTGLRPTLLYPVGSEFAASGLGDRWSRAGVDCSRLTRVPDRRSGCSWMFMQPDGTTMCFAYPGAAESALPASVDPLGDWVIAAPVLGSFTRAVIDRAVAQRKKLIVTGICSAELMPYLPAAHAVFVNAHEADILARHMGARSVDELAAKFRGTLLFVTRGGAGSAVYVDGLAHGIPVVPAESVLDVTGAGDAYTAGAVSGLLRGLPPAEAGLVGAACASFAVEGYGGQGSLPDLAALKERLAPIAAEVAAKI